MFDGQPQEIILYEKSDGTRPFDEWLTKLRDRRAVARIDARITRLQGGNPGDYKSIGAGVYELRIDYGPGYRLYFAVAGKHLLLLLLGGDKSSQSSDIANALKYWEDSSAEEGNMRKWEDSLKERLAASPEYAAEYLSAVLEENDPEALRLALQHVAEAQGTPAVIASASSRELPSLAATLDALGMHLLITPKQAA